jgi:mannitol-1-phosphate 5-dehydrogenase
MGHACCAYLGMYAGKTYIYEAVADENILLLTRSAMLESAAALAGKYGEPVRDLLNHTDDLLYRFSNRALGDTCARVGGDIRRKMAAEDRLIGAARLCQGEGIPPVYIALGAAGAVRQFLMEEGTAQGEAAAISALQTLSGMKPEDGLAEMILAFYRLFQKGAPLADIRAFAVEEKHRLVGQVI